MVWDFYFFLGHLELLFDVSRFATVELSLPAQRFQWIVKFKYMYETG